jgi:hypothetical protein
MAGLHRTWARGIVHEWKGRGAGRQLRRNGSVSKVSRKETAVDNHVVFVAGQNTNSADQSTAQKIKQELSSRYESLLEFLATGVI